MLRPYLRLGARTRTDAAGAHNGAPLLMVDCGP
jgi:hypothetical protein